MPCLYAAHLELSTPYPFCSLDKRMGVEMMFAQIEVHGRRREIAFCTTSPSRSDLPSRSRLAAGYQRLLSPATAVSVVIPKLARHLLASSSPSKGQRTFFAASCTPMPPFLGSRDSVPYTCGHIAKASVSFLSKPIIAGAKVNNLDSTRKLVKPFYLVSSSRAAAHPEKCCHALFAIHKHHPSLVAVREPAARHQCRSKISPSW